MCLVVYADTALSERLRLLADEVQRLTDPADTASPNGWRASKPTTKG